MAKIKCRVVSESGSNSDSPVNRIRHALSETDDNAFASSEAETDSRDPKGKAKAKSRTGPSPRRMLRRLSASEEIRRIEEETTESESDEESDVRGGHNSLDRSDSRRDHSPVPVQNGQQYGAPSTNPRFDYNADDLNRYVSSSTYPTNTNTGTTISTSFVKHKGRPPPPPSTMRMIRPDDVVGVMPDRVGKMRYDKVSMRWVRDNLETVDENGESRRESEESEDVFAGMESWRDDVRSLRQDLEAENAAEGREEEVEGEDEERTPQWSDSSASVSVLLESSPAPQLYPNPPSISPPPRPVPVHVNSAPPILTPRPGTSSPPKQLRSALRQPNSATPFNGGLKKRAGWHADLTPAPARADSETPISSRRSVSFSDGKKAGKIVPPDTLPTKWVAADEFFGASDKNGEGSWMAPTSERTKRIQTVFQDMEDLSRS